MTNSEINPYKSIDISNVKLHIGNGAKDKLKEEMKLYNFKFFYKVGIKYKQVSAGFDTIEDFLNQSILIIIFMNTFLKNAHVVLILIMNLNLMLNQQNKKS